MTQKVKRPVQRHYERLAELLNKTPDSALFQRFLGDFGENHWCQEIKGPKDDLCIYDFPELGVRAKTLNGIFFQIVMDLRGPTASSPSWTAYTGGFPCGIEPEDNATIVKEKIGRDPDEIEYEGGPKYHLPPFTISLCFDKASGQISLASLTRRDYPGA